MRLGDAGTITLYGPERSLGWLGKLPLGQRFEFLGRGAFDLPPLSFASEVSEKTLSEQGLAWHQAAPGTDALVCSGHAGAVRWHRGRNVGLRSRRL